MIGLIESTARSVAKESSSSSAANFFSSLFSSSSSNTNTNSSVSRSSSSPFFGGDDFSSTSSTAMREKMNTSKNSTSTPRAKLLFIIAVFFIVSATFVGIARVLDVDIPYVSSSKGSSSSSTSSSKSSKSSSSKEEAVVPSFDLLRHHRNDLRHDASHHVVAEPHRPISSNNDNGNENHNNNRRRAEEAKGDGHQHHSDDDDASCDKEHERKEHLKKLGHVELKKNTNKQQEAGAVISTTEKNYSLSNNNKTSSFPIIDWIFKQGTIRMRLRPDAAPLTVANMLRLIKEGKYNKTGCAYRYEKGFVMQFGLCSRIDHKTVPLEYKLPNEKYTVSMARSSNPHSGGTEFFINLANNSRGLGPQRKGGYAVFGEIVDGFETIKELKKLPVHSSAGRDKKTGKLKRGGLMLFDKPVPHLKGVVIVQE